MNELTISIIEDQLNCKINRIDSISGGDISNAFKIKTKDQNSYFVKCNSNPKASDMFLREKQGLESISKCQQIKVPQVMALIESQNEAVLVLEYIHSKTPDSSDFEQLGRQLAKLHECTNTFFGFEFDNYIGELKQINTPQQQWPAFFSENRLQVQLKLAGQKGLLSELEIPSLDTLKSTLKSLIPNEQASLLHGDLWSGNYLISTTGTPYLIDPAVYYGDKMVDIAMTYLFGGYPNAFYESYFYHTSEVNNKNERIDLYQLYYLLVHLNLFGNSYYPSVKRILDRYF